MQTGRGHPQRKEEQRPEAGLEGSLGQRVLSLNFCLGTLADFVSCFLSY